MVNKGWLYKKDDNHFTEFLDDKDIPEWAIGFVYKIENRTTGKLYIGKKILNSSRRVRMSQKERTELGTKRIFKVVKKPSNWETYNSSCKPLQEEIKTNPDDFKKTIIEWAYSKKNLHYLELKYQFLNNVLEIDSYNDNIGARIFRTDANYKDYLDYQNNKKK